MPYSPKTEKEKEEAYKLLDEFMNELAKRKALANVLQKFVKESLPSSKKEKKEE
jgi:hypothetical protein